MFLFRASSDTKHLRTQHNKTTVCGKSYPCRDGSRRPSHPGNEEHGIRYAIGHEHMRKMAYSSNLLQETET